MADTLVSGTKFSVPQRVQYAVGVRTGRTVAPAYPDPGRERAPDGTRAMLQPVRWDDDLLRVVDWPTHALRPERTAPEPQPELGGCW